MSSEDNVLDGREDPSHETPQAITITIMDPTALETTTLDSTLVTSVQSQDDGQGMSTLLVVPGEGHGSVDIKHSAKDILQTVTEKHMGTQELPVISSISNTEESEHSIQVTTKLHDGDSEGVGVSVGGMQEEEEGEDGEDGGEPLGQHCLICNFEMTSPESEKPIPFFKAQTSTTQRKMSVFLGILVGQRLTSRKAHSDIMCSRCFNLLDRVDALEVEIRDTREEIITKYQETVTAYGGRARRRKPAIAKKTDYVFPKVEPEDDILGLEMDKNFEPQMEDLMEEEQDHREDRSIQDEEWEPEFKRPKIKREISEPDPNAPPKKKRGRPRKDASRSKIDEEEEFSQKAQSNHTSESDVNAGDTSNPVRRSERQRRPSARHAQPESTPEMSSEMPSAPISPLRNISPDRLAEKLDLETLVCMCGMKSETPSEYVDHVMSHTERAFRCPVCPCIYTHSSRLAKHQRLLHGQRETAPAPFSQHSSVEPVGGGGESGDPCHLCGDAVEGGEALVEHVKSHLCGEHECPICALRLKSAYDLEKHVQRRHPDLLQEFLKGEDAAKEESTRGEGDGALPVRCDVCGKVVATPSRLARHRYLQHPEHYPWACANCSLAFPSTHARDHHLCPHRRKGERAASTRVRKNECLVCNATFKSRLNLEVHMRRAHPTEAAGPHACPACGRNLASRKALTDHLRYHRREGFACEFCGARLKSLDSLNVHINEIHTHVVRLQCSMCPQVFFSSGRLSYHVRRHHTDRRSYANLCDLCGKAYPYPSELRLHLRSHRNERPYKCDQCHKTFLKQGDLTYHKRSHTGERPHKCPHCDARFPRPNTLMSHMRQQHRENTVAAAVSAAVGTSTSTAPVAEATIMTTEPVITTATAVAPYVTPAPSVGGQAVPSSTYLATDVPTAPSAQPPVALQHHRPPPTVTVMGVAGGIGRGGSEATLVPVVEGRLVEGQLVEAVVDGQMTEMQPVQYVQVEGLAPGQTVQAVQAVQAVPPMVEGMEYDETGNVPYQIVHLQILQ